jgi:hypothetical protein
VGDGSEEVARNRGVGTAAVVQCDDGARLQVVDVVANRASVDAERAVAQSASWQRKRL